jgi:hypothetical protein
MEETNERAIAGRNSGLIQLAETVDWRDRHFGITQKFTAKITTMDSPHSFTYEMVNGAFTALHILILLPKLKELPL